MGEQYKPSRLDIVGAEARLTDAERTDALRRESVYRQSVDKDAHALHEIDRHDKRPVATSEAREKMDRALSEFGELFDGAPVRWRVVGALNVSLARGEYIGLHKDIDVEFDIKNLSALEVFLRAKGYAFFLEEPVLETDGQEHVLRRVSSREFAQGNALGKRVVARVDGSGKLVSAGPLTAMDAYVKNFDEPTNKFGTVLPEHWYHAPVIDRGHGRPIPTQHLADTAYHKLYFGRHYDLDDIRELVRLKKLHPDDIRDIEPILTQDEVAYRQSAKKFAEGVCPEIVTHGASPRQLAQRCIELGILPPHTNARRLLNFCEWFINNRGASVDAVERKTLYFFKIEKTLRSVRKNFNTLQRWVKNGPEPWYRRLLNIKQ